MVALTIRPLRSFKMRVLSRGFIAPVLLFVFAACDFAGGVAPLSSPPEPGTAVVNRDPAWTRSNRWKMSRSPIVEIGGSRGKGPQDLLKVVGVIRLDDGSVVVANASTAELKYFDRQGKFVTSIGGTGWTPGTFRVLGWIQMLESGEIAAFDESQRTLQLFDVSGNYVRSLLANYNARDTGPLLTIEGVFEDESVLIHQSRMAEGVKGSQRSNDWFVRVPPAGLAETVTDALPGAEVVMHRFVNRSEIMRPPFGRALHAAVAPTRFYVGDDDHYAISAYSPTGQLLHVVRLEGVERAVTDDDIDAYMDAHIPPNRDFSRATLEAPLRASINHRTMPAFSALRSDVDGNLWVREFDTEMPGDRHERWNIFDPNGLYLGVLEMPKAFSVLNVGDDYVAGVWKDAFGTERARVYDLKKPARR